MAEETTDLYQLDLATGATRRLTHEGDDGWIIPEFTWDPDNRYLFWTEQKVPDRARVPLPFDAAASVTGGSARLRRRLSHRRRPHRLASAADPSDGLYDRIHAQHRGALHG